MPPCNNTTFVIVSTAQQSRSHLISNDILILGQDRNDRILNGMLSGAEVA